MAVLIESFALGGGLDLVSPYLQVKPGRMIEGINYEALPRGGYRRVGGYDRYDGHAVRADVVHPVGSGPMRGVHVYGGVTYCVRDNAGGTAGVLYKATAAGWAAQGLGEYIQWTGGNQAQPEGTAITGAVSGATATIRRVVINGGTYGGGNATGLWVISGRVGNFQNGENLNVAGVAKAVANGTEVANALPPGGKYEFINYNFFGQASTKRMYGASGVGHAFEWDGTYFTPLIQGTPGVYPKHIVAHRDHLFLGYEAGSVVNSGTGKPHSYITSEGAAEIAYGDAIRALFSMTGGVLFVGCAESTYLLYGTNSSNWDKKEFTKHGVRARSVAEIGSNVLALDELGIQNLIATQNFGDFASILVSYDVASAIRRSFALNTDVVSVVSQSQDHYRLFFGKFGYYVTYNGNKLAGITPVILDHEVSCGCRGLDASGNEVLFFGSADGKVFKMNTTNFFDGQPVLAAMRLPFVFAKSPTQRKQFRRALLDMKVNGAAILLNGQADFDFTGGPNTRFTDLLVAASGGGSWDLSLWNNFNWSSPFYSSGECEIDGTGQNMSLVIVSTGEEDATHDIYGVVIHYSPRKLMR